MVDSLPCHGRGSGFDSRLARVMSNLNNSNFGSYGMINTYPQRTLVVKTVRVTVSEYDTNGNIVKETITETEYVNNTAPYTIYNT